MKNKNDKLYKLLNDINRRSKAYINEDKYSKEERKAKEYCKRVKIANGIKATYSTGVRTYPDFGVCDMELREDIKQSEEEEMSLDENKVAYNYIKLLMANGTIK